MAKSPKAKTDKSADENPEAQHAIEDAVVVDETEAEPVVEAEPIEAKEPESVSPEEPTEPVVTQEPMLWGGTVTEPALDASDSGEMHDEQDTREEAREEPMDDTPPPVAAGRKSGGSSSGFVGMVVGGLIAGVIGFGVAQYFVPGSWPFGGPEEDPTATALAEQTTRLEGLTAQVAENGSAIAQIQSDTALDDLGGQLRAEIVATQSRVAELSTTVATFEDRITALEKMPGGDSAEAAQTAADAYARELAAMREMLDTEMAGLRETQAQAETLQANAAQSAQAATARAALSRIMAALDTGQPFGDALFDLTSATGTEAPGPLAMVADDGVPTLAAVQEAFPEAARVALNEAIRAMVADGTMGRFEAFLRTQLGTRSLEPKEGDDPDAILSRAEFALHNGRLDEALEEVASLSDAAKPAMNDWVAMAETRRDAIAAGAALADSLNQ